MRVFRRVLDNPEFKDQGEALAFVWLVMRAAWKTTQVHYKGRQITLERGDVSVSVRDFGVAMGRSKDWADRFLKRLEVAEMIGKKSLKKLRQPRDSIRDSSATASATAVNVITICNYDIYQGSLSGSATAENKSCDSRATASATQNKEGNKRNERMNNNYNSSFYEKPSGWR